MRASLILDILSKWVFFRKCSLKLFFFLAFFCLFFKIDFKILISFPFWLDFKHLSMANLIAKDQVPYYELWSTLMLENMDSRFYFILFFCFVFCFLFLVIFKSFYRLIFGRPFLALVIPFYGHYGLHIMIILLSLMVAISFGKHDLNLHRSIP